MVILYSLCTLGGGHKMYMINLFSLCTLGDTEMYINNLFRAFTFGGLYNVCFISSIIVVLVDPEMCMLNPYSL